MMNDSILSCRNLSKNFGYHSALSGVNMDIPRGRIIGLLGPNGSGKTTFMKLANGLLVPSEGEIIIGGYHPGPETKKIVSFLPATEYLPDYMTVENLLKFFCDFFEDFNPGKAEDMLKILNINPKLRLKTLSKGTKEKVQLILAMSRQAQLYLLDEPIGGVDPAARDYILQTVIRAYRPQSSIILSTHLVRDVEAFLDDFILLRYGQMLLHAPVAYVTQEKGTTLDAFFREEFRC